MAEQTIIKTMPLPAGRDWYWYGDLNIIALSDRLDEAGRQLALTEVQCWWRRNCLEARVDELLPFPLVSTDRLAG